MGSLDPCPPLLTAPLVCRTAWDRPGGRQPGPGRGGIACAACLAALALALLAPPPLAADWLDDQRRSCLEHPDHERRVEACTWLINTDGQDPAAVAAAYYFRAVALAALGRFEPSLSDVGEAMYRHPGNPVYPFFRAYVHANLGRRRAAVTDIDRALMLGFDKPAEAWGFRGELHLHLGQPEQAVLDARRSLAHAPGLRAAETLEREALSAWRLTRCGDYESAAQAAREAAEAGSHEVAAARYRAALAGQEEARRFAAEHLRGQHFECATPRWQALVGLAAATRASGDRGAADELFEAALAADEGAEAAHAVADALLAAAPLQAAERARALAAARRAAQSAPRPAHLHTLAAAHAANGEHAAAVEAERAAIAGLASDAPALLAEYRLALARHEAAMASGAPPPPPAATVAAVPAAVQPPDSAVTAVGTIAEESWLLAQPADHYTLQLFASVNRARLLADLGRRELPGDVAVYRLSRDGQPWHAAVQGAYATRAEAEAAAGALVERLGSKPWVRRFADVQAAIRSR